MALSFLSGASHAKYFDIRLEDSYIVFRGSADEAASAHVKGNLVLCLSEPLTTKHLKLTLIGMSRICLHLPSGTTASGRRPWRERVFFEKQWVFRDAGKGKTETLPADNYEFPFDLVLAGSLPESIEGLSDTWVTYRFKAEIGRKYAKDIIVRKPLRIIRTLDPTALELAHAMSVENVWPNKIEYSISTPTKAIIFGTSVQIDFRLIPLLKGLEIGEITSQLIETHDLLLNPDDPETIQLGHKIIKVIVTDSYHLQSVEDMEIIDESAEGYQFSRQLSLPKNLSRCLQDADAKGIRVRHKLKFRVQLHNPDGHVSELRATLPIAIFISPNMPLDDNNALVDQTPAATQRAMDEFAHQAPPLYGEHQFDQLYSEVDMSGYRTPGYGSGPGTPFGSLSRNISSENLASMNAITSEDISASALHSRLSRLNITHGHRANPSTAPSDGHDSESGLRGAEHSPDYFLSQQVGTISHSPDSNSAPLSRRASEEQDSDHPSSGVATPYNPHFYEVETLNRVPSYATAVRSTARTAYSSDLPDYNSATAGDSASNTPQSPQPAHIRGGYRAHGTSTLPQVSSLSAFNHRHQPSHQINEDEERQLRLIQARAGG